MKSQNLRQIIITPVFLGAGKILFLNTLQVKWIIYAKDHDQLVIVQSATTDTAVSLGKQWGEKEVRCSRMAFIGKDLKPKYFDKMPQDCFHITALS